MKKNLFIVSCMFILSSFLYSLSFEEYLSNAKIAYELGNISDAIQYLDSAKSILEKEQLNSVEESYIYLRNWDIVKIKKSEYLGKKVKVRAMFLGVNTDGSIWLSTSYKNTYEESMIDEIIELTEDRYYTFCGTVYNGTLGPALHIEAIE